MNRKLAVVVLAGAAPLLAAGGIAAYLATSSDVPVAEQILRDPGATSDGETISAIPAGAAAKLDDGVSIDPELMQLRQVQGRWRSAVGVVPAFPDHWIELAISGSETWIVSLRNGTPVKPGVVAEANGRLRMGKADIAGEADKLLGTQAKLLSPWEGTQPQGGKISVSFGGKPAIEMTYAGL